ncbi:MAG: FtsX-like permease family protein [Chloroflexi bacterium]|nr:FtsX-like permease family protein [Chloroflexota bacterium]
MATLPLVRDLFAGWRFALQRLRAGWRFMLVAAIGVLVAATLLAAAPIYATTMSDLGLRFRLDRGLDEPRDEVVAAEVFALALGDPADAARRDALGTVTAARIGHLADEVQFEVRSGRLDLEFRDYADQAPADPVTPAPGTLVRQPWGAFITWSFGFEDHVRVVEGRLPLDAPTDPSTSAPTNADAPAAFEVVLPDGFQRHAAIGDVVRVTAPTFDDCQTIPGSDDPTVARDEVQCRPSAFASTTVEATIVGFIAPNDPTDHRWEFLQLTATTGDWTVPDQPLLPHLIPFVPNPGDPAGGPDPTALLAAAGGGGMPLVTTSSQLFDVLGAQLPELPIEYRIGLRPDLDSITLTSVSRTIDDLAAWDDDIGDRLGLLATRQLELGKQLETFRNAQTFSQVPLLLILLQVVGIVLFYVVLVMNMLLERQSEEIGVYVGRGASTTQIVGLSVVEGLVLAVPAAIAAPFLAQTAVRALGFTSTFDPITAGAALPATLSPPAFLLAATGAALALVAMLLPSFAAARRGIVDVKRDQARPAGRGIVQRYYLDVAIVILAALLLWQLQQRGTVFDPDSVGGWSTDPLLLLSPLVFTLAVAAMLLRFYPPLLRLAVRLLMLLRGTAVALGLRRAGRAPAAYARLMLLIVMAVSVGTFAASYGPTVDRSFTERTQYEGGVPFRGPIGAVDGEFRAADLEAVRDIEGIRDVALIHRGQITASTGTVLPLLAIDVPFARDLLWFRDDFAGDLALDDLLARLESAVPAGGGLLLPDDATAVQFAVRTEGERIGDARVSTRVILVDANGRYLESFSTSAAGQGWVTSVARVPVTLVPPIRLAGIEFTDQTTARLRAVGALVIDNIEAVSANGRRTMLEDFEGTFRWSIYGPPGDPETFEVTADARNGRGAARWTWTPSISANRRILTPTDPVVPVAALMNAEALGAFGSNGGTAVANLDGILVPFRVAAAVDYFPTMTPQSGIVVVNYEHLRSLAGAINVPALRLRSELWLDFDPGLSIEDQEAIVTSLQDRQAPIELIARSGTLLSRQLEEIAADPTIQASGSGILFVAFVAVLALSTLGFVVTLVLSASRRTVEFAVLRTVGASSWQIFRAMLLEWGTVLVIGATIGVILGRQVAAIMLSFLEVTEEGVRVLPPFILETDWTALGIGIGALVTLVAITLTLAWTTAMRRANASELRITQ